MKVYVDELPKGCKCGCAYCYHEIQNTYYCSIQNKYIEFFGNDYLKRQTDCPLQSLAEHDKQVRKEVVQEIREQLKEVEKFHPEDDFEIDYEYYIKEDVYEVLEKVEKGE